ncbi:hypothetical protein KVP10_08615 [Candidimonas humi]|uniref:Holin n=1 Tax=Candidimonas humi TaxID=683355 RepID=A0ABV8NUG3_9BURK|nr:hypothetical protein [Candidimonas humi]MBV6304949.1 hypothetical protein [Candidimonas humi]
MPDEIKDPKLLSIVLGTLGSVLSMTSFKGLSRTQRVAMVITGTTCAGLFAQPVIELVGAPAGWAGGISFLIGTLGWSLIDKTVSTIRKADLWGLASDIARSWLSRKG